MNPHILLLSTEYLRSPDRCIGPISRRSVKPIGKTLDKQVTGRYGDKNSNLYVVSLSNVVKRAANREFNGDIKRMIQPTPRVSPLSNVPQSLLVSVVNRGKYKRFTREVQALIESELYHRRTLERHAMATKWSN